jgi:glycosyltransferase involved in cell wall biosynthesis
LVVDPANRPYRTFFQAIFHELMIRSFEKQSLRSADKVVAVSRYTATKISEIYRYRESEVIYNGIDTNFFSPGAKKPHQTFRILYVGNLSKRKGADLLPEIMKKLGEGYHLSLTSGLRTQNLFPDITNISALGRLTRDELLAAYQNSDILLFPSRLEGFGMACAEAMACELPVVATDCSSLPEIIEDGISGILCPVDDVNAFVAAIRKLYMGGKENLSRMGRRARERIVRHFDARYMAVNYHNLISALRQSLRVVRAERASRGDLAG